jgi:hypothetical protein
MLGGQVDVCDTHEQSVGGFATAGRPNLGTVWCERGVIVCLYGPHNRFERDAPSSGAPLKQSVDMTSAVKSWRKKAQSIFFMFMPSW